MGRQPATIHPARGDTPDGDGARCVAPTSFPAVTTSPAKRRHCPSETRASGGGTALRPAREVPSTPTDGLRAHHSAGEYEWLCGGGPSCIVAPVAPRCGLSPWPLPLAPAPTPRFLS